MSTAFATKQSRRKFLIDGARATAAAAALAAALLAPVGISQAAPASQARHVTAHFEDDEQVIVRRGDDSTASDDDVSLQSDDDVGGDQTAASEDDTSGPSDDDISGTDAEDDGGDLVFTPEDEGAPLGDDQIMVSGIGKPEANLAPNEWQGAMDGRLVEPFATAPRPETLTIASIGVKGVVSTGDIVGGEMQTPKDEKDIVWYKETGRPGEQSNMVFAAHLNWYGVPEAIFFDIDKLQEGDEIVVTGEDGVDYKYSVTWVKLVPTSIEDLSSIVGPTAKPSVTLITCGGTWDGSAGQYGSRTVVRAEFEGAL